MHNKCNKHVNMMSLCHPQLYSNEEDQITEALALLTQFRVTRNVIPTKYALLKLYNVL